MRRDTMKAFRARTRAIEAKVDAASSAIEEERQADWAERVNAEKDRLARLAAVPAVARERIAEARFVRLRDGFWYALVKVNRTTVTVMRQGFEKRVPLSNVIEVHS